MTRRAPEASLEPIDAAAAIRKRPGMYLGDVCAADAVEHLVVTALAWTIEAFAAGELTRVEVVLRAGGEIEVEDDGPGVSLARRGEQMHAERALSQLMIGEGGAAGWWLVVSAVSQRFEADVFRDGRHVRLVTERGAILGPAAELGSTRRHGTKVKMVVDPEIFMTTEVDARSLARALAAIAAFAPGLRLQLRDERPPIVAIGAAEDARDLLAMKDGALQLRGEAHGVVVEVALRWDPSRIFRRRLQAFVNHRSASAAALEQPLFSALAEVVAPRVPKQLVRVPSVAATVAQGLDAVVAVSWRGWSVDRDLELAIRKVLRRALPRALEPYPLLLAQLRSRVTAAARARKRLAG